jgi:hypothetical protein
MIENNESVFAPPALWPRVIVLAAIAAAGCVSPAEPPAEPLPVPFAVSDYYSPDGFFGDGETRGLVELTKTCPERVPGAQGDCYTVTYRPGVQRYGGVFWQYPHNNWGYWPGHQIAPGATRIQFRARGARGGEGLTAGAGQTNTPNAHNDAFKLEGSTFALTDRWTAHEVPFRGANYVAGSSGVIGAFLVTLVAPDDDRPTTVHVDDIRWAP